MFAKNRVVVSAIVLVVLAATTVGCQRATAGQRCRGGVARDARHVLACQGGRWVRTITLEQAARAIAERQRATATATATATPATDAGGGTLLAVGDIARCGGDHPQVAQLLRTHAGWFVPLGDLIQGSNPDAEYAACYAPEFASEFARSRPAPGNHEYEDGSPPQAYLQHLTSTAAPAGRTWYSYDVGRWHVVSLNSNCTQPDVGGCGPGSPQYQWLMSDLAASSSPCLLAYWHHSPFGSTPGHRGEPSLLAMLLLLQSEGLDVLLSGHLHHYERFARMTAVGQPDSRGFRAFVVGTGGASHHALGAPRVGSEVRNAYTFGLLRLDLRAEGYDWQFLPTAGATFTDAGRDGC